MRYTENINYEKGDHGQHYVEFCMAWEGKKFFHRLAIDSPRSFEASPHKERRLNFAREECIKQMLCHYGIVDSFTDDRDFI